MALIAAYRKRSTGSCDSLADLHFCVCQTSIHQLTDEGIADSVH